MKVFLKLALAAAVGLVIGFCNSAEEWQTFSEVQNILTFAKAFGPTCFATLVTVFCAWAVGLFED